MWACWSFIFGPAVSRGISEAHRRQLYRAHSEDRQDSVTFEILGTVRRGDNAGHHGCRAVSPAGPTRIFFGNAFGNYTFSDMRVLPERPRGQKK